MTKFEIIIKGIRQYKFCTFVSKGIRQYKFCTVVSKGIRQYKFCTVVSKVSSFVGDHVPVNQTHLYICTC